MGTAVIGAPISPGWSRSARRPRGIGTSTPAGPTRPRSRGELEPIGGPAAADHGRAPPDLPPPGGPGRVSPGSTSRSIVSRRCAALLEADAPDRLGGGLEADPLLIPEE